jgi:hypothetical protein
MIRDLDCRDQNSYKQTVHYLEETFDNHGNRLQKVKEIAQRIKNEIAGISPFIQQTTQIVCPDCKDVCCINKHGYYNYEDLVYCPLNNFTQIVIPAEAGIQYHCLWIPVCTGMTKEKSVKKCYRQDTSIYPCPRLEAT